MTNVHEIAVRGANVTDHRKAVEAGDPSSTKPNSKTPALVPNVTRKIRTSIKLADRTRRKIARTITLCASETGSHRINPNTR
jgi:hypothetical protein